VKSFTSEHKKSSDSGNNDNGDDHKSSGVKSEQKSFVNVDRKITLCHLTGNGTYVAITVDKHSLKHGHTAAKGDVIPMPAGGCPAGVQVVQARTDCSAPSVTVNVTKSESQGTNQEGQYEGEHQDDNSSTSSSTSSHSSGKLECAKSDTKGVVVQQVAACAAPMVAVKVEDDDHSDQHGQFEGRHSDNDGHSNSTTFLSSDIKCVQPENLAPAVVVQQQQQQQQPSSCSAPLVAVTVVTETNQQGQFEGQHSDTSSTTTVYKVGDVTCVAPANLVTPTVTPTAFVAGAVVTPTTTGASTQAPIANASGALGATQGQPVAAQPQGGVAGAQASLNQPAQDKGGVLGVAGNIAGASLPFTGFPLWIAVLLALVLIGVGLMVRRRSTDAPRL
jgi:hypothetical protein